MAETYDLHPIGVVRSPLQSPREAPRQAFEGAPPARVEVLPEFRDALDGLAAGDEVVVLTWLHRASRDVRHVHPAATRACRSRASSPPAPPAARTRSAFTA
jgi:tRNA (Thr-GGU) A37 N-methylase